VRVVGIDPGATGALAFLTLAADGLALDVECIDLPTMRIGSRTHLDAYALARLIDARSGEQPSADIPLSAAIIEQGGARPQNGRVGAAAFWLGLGEIRGIIAAHFIPLEIVSPFAWKRGLRIVGDKDASRARASSLLPRWSDQWARKCDHGRAEAALIALYGASRLPIRQIA
jgi:crossover junction endodeoxyribonuclease RuvC